MARPVLFDHDGALEDIASLLLLLTYDDVDLRGVTVTPADCLIEPAVSVTRKVLDLADRSEVVTAAGHLQGPNPFPLDWRLDALRVDHLPQLNRADELIAPLAADPAHVYLARQLAEATEPITVLAIGPLTNLAWCLDNDPALAGKIRELVYMGGALEVAGNVDQPGHDGSAEWNVYWDPAATARVFDSDIPVTLFPLDATDQVPVTREFCHGFGRQADHPFSVLGGTLWAMTHGTAEATGLPYYCWDTLTTAYLAQPDLCEFEEVGCEVITDGPSQGRTVVTSSGRPVKAAVRVDAGAFYDHCLDALRR